MLWLAMERGASVIVASLPPGAGKTAILTALLAFTPPETVAYFTKGVGETFDLPPLADSHFTYLLINELSDHLPVYTWGPYARRAFELLAQGYRLASTMHAATPLEVVEQLRGIGIPDEHLAHLDLLITLQVSYVRHQMERRVESVTLLQLHPTQKYRMVELARWRPEGDVFSVLEGEGQQAFASWADITLQALDREMEARAQFLRSLYQTGVVDIPAVAQAIEEFRRGRR